MFADDKPLTFRDFYRAKQDSDSEGSFEDDEGQVEEGPWNTKKTAGEVKKGIYKN
jgi:hypothetical protein